MSPIARTDAGSLLPLYVPPLVDQIARALDRDWHVGCPSGVTLNTRLPRRLRLLLEQASRESGTDLETACRHLSDEMLRVVEHKLPRKQLALRYVKRRRRACRLIVTYA